MDTRTFHTPNGLQLELKIPAGSIEVRTHESDETILDIRGERDPERFSISLDDLGERGHRLRVEHRDRKAFGWGGDRGLRVEVVTPIGCRVTADTGSADLRVLGECGSVTFRSGSGDLQLDRVTGDVTAKVASGDLRGASVQGALTAHSASGDADFSRVGGPIICRTASGDLSIGSAGGSIEAMTASGDVHIGEVSSGNVQAKSMSGDITVGVARGVKVWLDMSSVSGDAESELDMSDGSEAETMLELRLSTMSGDVRVERAAAHAAHADV